MKKKVLTGFLGLIIIFSFISMVFAAVKPAPVAPEPTPVSGTECSFLQKLLGNCLGEEFKTSCIDYDEYNDVERIGIVEYNIKGDKIKKTLTDECINENIVTEYYCKEEWEANFDMIPVNFQNKNCPAGFKCQKGYCSPSGTNTASNCVDDSTCKVNMPANNCGSCAAKCIDSKLLVPSASCKGPVCPKIDASSLKCQRCSGICTLVSGASSSGGDDLNYQSPIEIGTTGEKGTYHSILWKCQNGLENSWSSPNCLTQEQLKREAESRCLEGECKSCKQNFCDPQLVNYENQCPLVANYKYKFGNYKCSIMPITVGDGNCYSKDELNSMAEAKCADFCTSKEVLNYCPACKIGSFSFREECGGDDTGGDETPLPTEQTCFVDSDCVAAECCHANSAVNKKNAPKCLGVACTKSCEGALDCGKAKPACINKKCIVLPLGGKCENVKCVSYSPVSNCGSCDTRCINENELKGMATCTGPICPKDKQTVLECACDPEDGLCKGKNEISIDDKGNEGGDKEETPKPYVPWSCSGDNDCPGDIIGGYSVMGDTILRFKPCVNGKCPMSVIRSKDAPQTSDEISEDGCDEGCVAYLNKCRWQCVKESEVSIMQKKNDKIVQVCAEKTEAPECSCSNNVCVQRSGDGTTEIPPEEIPVPEEIPEEPSPAEEPCSWLKKLFGLCSEPKPNPVYAEAPEGALFIGNAPFCDRIGTNEEGWYIYTNSKKGLLKFGECKGCEAECKYGGEGKGIWFDCEDKKIGGACYFLPTCGNGKSKEGWYNIAGKRLKSGECEECIPKCQGGRWVDCNGEIITNEITCDSFAESCPLEIDEYVCKKYGGEWNRDSGCLCDGDYNCNLANGYSCRGAPGAKGHCVKAGICQAKKVLV